VIIFTDFLALALSRHNTHTHASYILSMMTHYNDTLYIFQNLWHSAEKSEPYHLLPVTARGNHSDRRHADITPADYETR